MEARFNIWDNSERAVVCVSNADNEYMKSAWNHPLLEVGKKYTVAGVEVSESYTLVRLKEFPNKTFNSLVFNEVA